MFVLSYKIYRRPIHPIDLMIHCIKNTMGMQRSLLLPKYRPWWVLVVLTPIFQRKANAAFVSHHRQLHASTRAVLGKRTHFGSSFRPTTTLCLVPIREFRDKFTFLSQPADYRCCIDQFGKYDDYDLGLAEEQDLPDIARFVVNCFGADAIRLSQDIGAFERMLMTPAVELVNGYSGIVAFAEVLAGLRYRMNFRLKSGMGMSLPSFNGLNRDEKIRMAAGSSIVLVLAKKLSDDTSDWHSEVIASVELQLQPCDAKIPFTLPWFDKIERKIASFIGIGKNDGRDLQPYLSNLSVDESMRGKGVGRALVRAVESVASSCWGCSRIYLHVDADNDAAVALYRSEGYRDVGLRWAPFWAGGSKDIGYYYKPLGLFPRNDRREIGVSKKKNRDELQSERK